MRTKNLIGITVDGLRFTGSYSNVEPRRYADPLHDAARDAT